MSKTLYFLFSGVQVEQAGAMATFILGLPIPTAAAGLARRAKLALADNDSLPPADVGLCVVMHNWNLSTNRRVGPPAKNGDTGPAIDTQPKMSLSASFLFAVSFGPKQKPDLFAEPEPEIEEDLVANCLRDMFWSSRFAGGALLPPALRHAGDASRDDPFTPIPCPAPLESLQNGQPGHVLVDRTDRLALGSDNDPIDQLFAAISPVAEPVGTSVIHKPAACCPILIGYQSVEAAPVQRSTRLGRHAHIHVEDVLGLGEYVHVKKLTAEDPLLWSYSAPDGSLPYPAFISTASTLSKE